MRGLGLLLIPTVLGVALGASVGVAAGYTMKNFPSIDHLPVKAPYLDSDVSTASPIDANQASNAIDHPGRSDESSSADTDNGSSPRMFIGERISSTRSTRTPVLAGGKFVQWSMEVSATAFDGICGDVNSDRVVAIDDAITLLKITTGLVVPSTGQTILGDLNKDGAINIIDVVIELQAIVGLLPSLERCGLIEDK